MLLNDAYLTLAAFIQAQTAMFTPNPIVYIDIAPIDAIQNLARGGPALIGIFDRHMSRNTTRWNIIGLTPTLPDPKIVSTVSNSNLFPGFSQTITLSVGVNVGDAVSAIIKSGVNTYSQATIAQEGATLDSMATNLAAAINSDPKMGQFVIASATGPVVNLVNIGGIGQQLSSLTGSAGSQITEWAREEHSVQVDLMAQTYQQRNAIGSQLLGQFAKTQATFGLKQPDGTWMRVRINSNMPSRDTSNSDIYRWIFLLDIEIGLTTADAVYTMIQPTIVKTLSY